MVALFAKERNNATKERPGMFLGNQKNTFGWSRQDPLCTASDSPRLTRLTELRLRLDRAGERVQRREGVALLAGAAAGHRGRPGG